MSELARWAPVAVSFVWLIFFGYTNETRRLYGPILRRLWEFTPFATRRTALEPLTFGTVAAQPRRRLEGEISDFSGFSVDEAPTAVTAPIPADVEPQAENGPKGPGAR